MKQKFSQKLNIILENQKEVEKKKEAPLIFDEKIMRVIRTLSENNWYRSKRTRVIAARNIQEIAESRDRVARSFMKAINKAARTIALHLENKNVEKN